MSSVRAAYVGLTDAAVLVVARHLGFAEDQGLALELIRDSSWAALRDRLVYGQVQAAHMLAPLAVGVSLGLSQQQVPLAAPYKLSVNGNLLVMAPGFTAALDQDVAARINDPLAAAHDFAAAIGLHRRKPVIGIVHRLSSHALMLRYWLASAGVDPDRDVELRVLPPSLMVDAMRSGLSDGFIAGEPWGSSAIDAGLAEAVAAGVRIWQRGVEKVLALRTDWMDAHPDVTDALLRALVGAAQWCDDPANHQSLAELLAREAFEDMPAERIRRALAGQMRLTPTGPDVALPDFLLFEREASSFPWRSQALWIYSQLVRWDMVDPSADMAARAAVVFRPDIYRRALSGSSVAMPAASMKVEGSLDATLAVGASPGGLTLGPDRFFDGRVFDPERIADYLAGFSHPR